MMTSRTNQWLAALLAAGMVAGSAAYAKSSASASTSKTAAALKASKTATPPAASGGSSAKPADPKPADPKTAKAEPTKTAAPAPALPFIPAAIALDSLFQPMGTVVKTPTFAPTGIAPLYTPADWDAYRTRFGEEADKLLIAKSSAQREFAAKLAKAAEAEPATSGLRRLLLFRAAAIAYRHKDAGSSAAGRYVAALQANLDINSPTQVAALWSLCDTMARQSVTPKAERPKYAALAARANIQLTQLLVNQNQTVAAQEMVKLLPRHEGAIRADDTLRADARAVRRLTTQTADMLDSLAKNYQALLKGDESAGVPLYLYARLIHPMPTLMAELANRRPGDPVSTLHAALEAAQKDGSQGFAAAQALQKAVEKMPDGMIRQRAFYLAVKEYRAFIASPKTDDLRIERTLARLALQKVAAENASGPVVLHPLEPPADKTKPPAAVAAAANTTQPVSTKVAVVQR